MRLTAVLSLAVAVAVAAVPNGQTLSLHDIPYYVSGIPVASLEGNRLFASSLKTVGQDLLPLTVIPVDASTNLESLLSSFSEDDVFQPGFLQTVYLTSSSGKKKERVPLGDYASTLKSAGNDLLFTEPSLQSTRFKPGMRARLSEDLPKGPYFVSIHTGEVFRAYRLYPDDYVSFIQAAISDEKGGWMPLPAVTENVMTKDVAVPSRLYYTVTAEKPLAGLRLGVKDIFHVQGLKTSGGSRSYYYLYDTQNVTAPSIQRLLDLGAVFVGKTGTIQFAQGDKPTADWVALHCPFNPRGDGYQNPSGSSSGSGASIAAYDWLDLTVGSDTGGSMRGPASVQGVYGNRPSTGAIDLSHVLPLSPVLDTAGMFARTPQLWAKTVQAWYPSFATNYTTFPRKVYLERSGWEYSKTPEAQALIATFMAQLSAFLNTNHTLIDWAMRWNETNPPSTPPLTDLLYETYATLTSVDQYNLLATPFYADYAAAHSGRRPFINPAVLARWNWSQNLNRNASYPTALTNLTTFRTWWETSGYGRPDPLSCSESVLVSVFSTGRTDYRNAYFGPTESPPLGFATSRISVFAGAPEVVVPLGESPYESTITMQKEYLPVTVSLQMARGCDNVLADLVSALGDEGILKPVMTGPRMYERAEFLG